MSDFSGQKLNNNYPQRIASRFTHLGQLKGSVGKGGGKMIKGVPIYSLTANKDGLMVRFSNLDSIDDYHEGLEKHLDWKESTGLWVHVKIVTTFGESMEVTESAAVTKMLLIRFAAF